VSDLRTVNCTRLVVVALTAVIYLDNIVGVGREGGPIRRLSVVHDRWFATLAAVIYLDNIVGVGRKGCPI
jgi:hypothetical protein